VSATTDSAISHSTPNDAQELRPEAAAPERELHVLVAQNGARHNYAIPAVLAEIGALEAFYTDAYGQGTIERLATRIGVLPGLRSGMRRLEARQVPEAVARATRSFPLAAALDAAGQRVAGLGWGTPALNRCLRSVDLGGTNLVYSSLGWGRELLQQARARGIPVVTELYARPSLVKTYQDEFRAFPGWEAEMPLKDHGNDFGTERDPCTVSDYVIAPSESVADEVVAWHGFPRDRIQVVPYGIDDTFFEIDNRPMPGRVLFAGTCCLWKGIHYFAMAAQSLTANGPAYDFRVAGSVTAMIRNHPMCRQLTFLGRVPRGEMKREYAQADVMAFPTLGDSFGVVQLEAMAAGIPIVTTRMAGAVLRDGIDGLLVPERDPQALAEAIARIVEDRELRERMATASKQRARDFTWARYGERLVTALRRLETPP